MAKRKNVTQTIVTYAVYASLIFVARVLDKAITGFLPINAAVITLTVAFSCALIRPSLLGSLAVGTMFGVVSLFATLVMGGTPDFLNPLVSVVPRMVVGVALFVTFYGVYKLFYLMTKNMVTCMSIAVILACVVGALVNTATVLGMIDIINMNGEWFTRVLNTVIAVNGALELSVPPILTPIIVLGARRGLRIHDQYNTHQNDLKKQKEGENAL